MSTQTNLAKPLNRETKSAEGLLPSYGIPILGAQVVSIPNRWAQVAWSKLTISINDLSVTNHPSDAGLTPKTNVRPHNITLHNLRYLGHGGISTVSNGFKTS